ncbi:protease modulator HflC [Guyparkeria hydrothermalis]|uniref:Protein HflC n=1 Tax=Guyparkeria halophila TaxID=47960 RepID=A0A6I6DBN3_9GAMM|nr:MULTISPECIES: protease modulator HflC [Guyparkeria]MCL7750887.1 protease modulator HflC [Guyparkeria hydrothermalis]QGT79122.1 protease modulator HflC [Guyparkeria halophila]TKA90644.1 protease modulator HflC [Guyparkeria sp. SB14A]
MNWVTRLLLPIIVVIVFLYATATFQVAEYQEGVKFRLGEIVETDFEPGLHFKLPFVNSVRLFDTRILSLSTPPERFLTSEKKNLIVDYYIKWRITNPADFYRATRGQESVAESRLNQIVKDSMKSQISSRTIAEVVSGDRDLFMRNVIETTNEDISGLGLEIVDVRIMRIELPQEVRESVYSRMEKERSTVAKAIRSRGEEQAKRITSDADRQRVVIISEAEREADEIRGEGDAEAARIYAESFGQDEEFFAFYRSIQAYQKVFANGSDTFVLSPDSPFFRYFESPNGTGESGDAALPAR